jgi:DNA (cytosine-5)-methyltransferase 1
MGKLASRGYDAEWQDIPAAFVGAPHWRSRQWIIAYPQRGERGQESYFRTIGRMGRVKQSVAWDRDWESALAEFRGMDDGIPRSVAFTDGYRNAVVPQIPELIGRAILEANRVRQSDG